MLCWGRWGWKICCGLLRDTADTDGWTLRAVCGSGAGCLLWWGWAGEGLCVLGWIAWDPVWDGLDAVGCGVV